MKVILYFMAQGDPHLKMLNRAKCRTLVDIFLYIMAGEDQQDHTKTSQTGSECPPCTWCAPSSTCWSSWPLGRTCNPLDEVRIRFHG